MAVHSSATGRSAVPAAKTATSSDRGAAGRQTTVEPETWPSWWAASAAVACSASARDRTTGPPSGSASRSPTMATHCSTDFPGP